ncbi:MAG TPA: SoxR reducing system RseC family protein [Nitrospirae bacterium]|nr:SoxR reducing system RseC family protein [Nitrospirota bacterium]
MEEIGIVKEIKGRLAAVSVLNHNTLSCEGCPGGKLCTSTDKEERLIDALNILDAKVGDRVKIDFKSLSYLSGILLVYGIPCIMLIFGAIVGKELLSSFFPAKDPEAISAGTGFAFFILSFLIIKIISRLLNKNRPVIVAIIE